MSDATLAESHKTNKKSNKSDKSKAGARTINKPTKPHSEMNGAALVSPQAAEILQQTEGTLGTISTNIKYFLVHKNICSVKS